MIKVLIIDDEFKCSSTLQSMLEIFCPQVQVLAICNDSRNASDLINQLKPELLFLDVEMPHLNGFDVLGQLTEYNFGLIFTTAHNHYALKAIKFSAIDYLLKPIDGEELSKAVLKYQKTRINHLSDVKLQIENLLQKNANKLEKLTIPTVAGMLFLEIQDIIRCTGERNYTRFFLTSGEQVLSSYTLKEYEQILESHNFFRLHQSDIINLKHMKSYIKNDGGYVIMSDGSEVQISRRRKDEFLGRL